MPDVIWGSDAVDLGFGPCGEKRKEKDVNLVMSIKTPNGKWDRAFGRNWKTHNGHNEQSKSRGIPLRAYSADSNPIGEPFPAAETLGEKDKECRWEYEREDELDDGV